LFYLKEYNEAISFLISATQIAFDKPEIQIQAYAMIAEAHNYRSEHELSDAAFEKVLQLDPNNALVLNNYSYYLSLRKENLQQALNMSAKAVKLFPNNAHFLDTYGWIFFQMEQYTEAEKHLKKAVDVMTQPNPTILMHYGDVLHKLGKFNEAQNFWKKALDAGGNENELKLRFKD